MEHLLKFLEIIMNMTVSKSQLVSQQFINTFRQLMIRVLISCGALVLFCVGVSMAVLDLAEKIDQNALIGSGLALLSLFVLVYILSAKKWDNKMEKKEEAKAKLPNPIEEALALLIVDFVSERRSKRESTHTQPQEHA